METREEGGGERTRALAMLAFRRFNSVITPMSEYSTRLTSSCTRPSGASGGRSGACWAVGCWGVGGAFSTGEVAVDSALCPLSGASRASGESKLGLKPMSAPSTGGSLGASLMVDLVAGVGKCANEWNGAGDSLPLQLQKYRWVLTCRRAQWSLRMVEG